MSGAIEMPLEEQLARGEGGWGVSFTVGGQPHVCDARLVEEVLDAPVLRSLPDMPHAVAGVLSVRGALIPVLELSALMARGMAPAGAECAVLLLALGEHRVGVRVERTGGVLFLDPAAVRLAAPAERERSPGVLGVVRTEVGLHTLIDPVVILERR